MQEWTLSLSLVYTQRGLVVAAQTKKGKKLGGASRRTRKMQKMKR
jgi:hypothetical protein